MSWWRATACCTSRRRMSASRSTTRTRSRWIDMPTEPIIPVTRRPGELVSAAVLAAIAFAVSPIGLRLATGRLDLSPRITILSITFAVGLAVLACAVAASGRLRRGFLYLLMCWLPVALFAAAELAALSIHLADRIAPLEDLSVLANGGRWPPHLMSNGRRESRDGLSLYRPWQGEGIAINSLGLRTPLPSPKQAGEWRIAVTGGSAAWGWRVLDADTITVQLQQILRAQGHPKVSVYNFGVDSMVIADELAVLKRFRETYAIDQVIFYTGGNDATGSYMGNALAPDGVAGLVSGINAFELLKVASRLKARMAGPSPGLIARFDNERLPELARRNSLHDGVAAANAYCRANALRCDFVLQPMLLTRKNPRGPEARMTQSLELIYPRYREVIETMYRSVSAMELPVHDEAGMFDSSPDPHFFDAVHINESGNRRAAERIAALVGPRLP